MKLFLKTFFWILFEFVKSDQISVALVVDATTSMKHEIQEVRKICGEILDHFHNREDKFIANYVLSLFRDPNVDQIMNTTDPKIIENELKNIVAEAPDNFDCAEASLSGIDEALNYTLPNSLMFVFTDDEPKDTHLHDTVLSKLRENRVKVTFLLTDSAKCKNAKNYSVYENVAQTTAGLKIELKEVDIKDTLKTLSNQFDPNYSVIDSENYEPGEQNKTFYVSIVDKELTVHTTAPDVIVNGPDKIKHSPKTAGVLRYFIVSDPRPGAYIMTTNSSKNSSILIGAISNIKLDYGFSLSKTESKENTFYQPVKGKKQYLTVFVNNSDHLKKLTSIKFIQNRKQVKEIELQKVNDKLYRTTSIKLPQGSLKVSVEGIDSADHKISRMLSNAVIAESSSESSIFRHSTLSTILLVAVLLITQMF